MLNEEFENSTENQSGEKGVVKKFVNERAKNLTYRNAGIFVAIVAAVILIIALSANQKEAINAQEYLKYTIAGANGYAKVTTSFDSYSVCDDINDEINDYMKTASISDALKDTSIEVSKLDKLSNGDTINIILTYNKEALAQLGYKLKNTTFNVQVSGLVEPIVLDPFVDLSVEFVGISPEAQVKLTNNSTNNAIKDYILYTVGGNTNYYKNGDSITITAELKNNDGPYILGQTDKEYVVSVDTEYIYSSDDLSEDIISYCNSKSSKYINSMLNNYSLYKTADMDYMGASVTNMELCNVYVLDDSKSTSNPYYNYRLLFIYKCDLNATYGDKKTGTVYAKSSFNDLNKSLNSVISSKEDYGSPLMGFYTDLASVSDFIDVVASKNSVTKIK